ncbi:hypothetical protein SD457_14095 [Coprobacillaceae bacterium CR2/5/TPMF4]|nr:hypothetical protein SD457_14095 [Coprobacillaceae bacterium CR2/5/TPMF4]
MLTARQLLIFKCIVDEFIETAEPVGSKTLMNKYQLPYSSATIRNEMSNLEEYGYIEKLILLQDEFLRLKAIVFMLII